MADEIIVRYEADWQKVVDWLTGPVPEGREIFYQKHMAHHFLPSVGRQWLSQVTNCFLIRDPREMLPSYVRKNGIPRLVDTGFPQMLEIFDLVRQNTGRIPPVVDSRDVLEDPGGTLVMLCEALGVSFSEKMLAWPPGPRRTDGIWASHWYPEVLQSTMFAPYAPKSENIPPELHEVYGACDAIYKQLHEHRLQ